ncbi:MAG: M20/M25/M40 family metallo-hydrolase [Acidobacteria bacterium]|nr:M20/M25/M40 family metallo-hydrolase [Acidobacteriota bacterium]NIM63279.1 M20/M25/M40 family metallo-hydrolase [Acidobacteriota bacterium]NIO60851.1 M20/M25/M40 family metallo-hydrolase [Acidobacteriota bacterium]NIQ31930.1 M20/M25/M40 family metallo-hydrolase [Acidobacteriota bacterium]NIQ87306.1 M20/M25/M40 family metallo-hydrolase [Acidobacteriota bacterium]
MSTRFLTLVLVVCASCVAVFAQAPSTDIFVFPVNGTEIGEGQRVTDREGYDNQPKFLSNGTTLVYSSLRDGQTDIYRHDLGSGESSVVLTTEQSEYSPTPVPGTGKISLVRDYGELKQQLWSVDLESGEETLLLPDINPVGYHAWTNDGALILFVLGEPHTLQFAEIGPGPGTLLADSPGRGLARIPGQDRMSYVDKTRDEWWLTAIDPRTGETERLIATPAGREDYAWAPDGSIWIGDDSRLLRWTPGGESGWQRVADLDARGVYEITRVTFSEDGTRLAVVGRRPPADLTAAYRSEAGQILGAALTDVEGWDKLTYLATVIGHRLSGSPGLEQAIDWAVETMQAEGLRVHKQPVMVPHWVRGRESLVVLEPRERELRILGLGNSVGTPPEGITAPVVIVGSFEELEALGRERVEGKIVVYAVEWEGYGRTVQFRSRGASRAAALGAVAALIRSATGHSLNTPHTGALRYDEDHPEIPAAALTAEDAAWFRRMAELGRDVTVRLTMEARMLDDVESYNVIAEIPGSERPEEIVVMGGHYDSWDVGEGVHDDGAACVAAWQALRLIDRLGLRPRRTLRVVLWTNEENGLRGGREYRAALSDEEVANHVAAIEMDGGCERPVGFGFGLSGVDPTAEERDPGYERALVKLEQIGRLLEAIDAQDIRRGGGGADIGPLMRSGVPGLGLRTVGEHYFDWHHTDADTLDKVDPQSFRKAIALLGVMGYVLADMPERLIPIE